MSANSQRSSSSSSSSSSFSLLSPHTLRQLKFVVPGIVVTSYVGVTNLWWRAALGMAGTWHRTAAFASLTFGLTTLLLFLYILWVPWARGTRPNYETWRSSPELSYVVPVLTVSIVLGWVLLSITLSETAMLGYIGGVIGASGFYALSFGLLGLLPGPTDRREERR